MVPVLSAAVNPYALTQEQIECVTSCIMSGTEAVCAAKCCCTATPCLAGAYAIARTTINVVKGLQGAKNIVQCAYVDNLGTCAPDCQFFASEVYTMCTHCCCVNCLAHPGTCFSPPIVPCVPPVNWTCDYPDTCRDEYLASICREMTCKCGTTELCWRPRKVDYDAARASNLTHQLPARGASCSICHVPRSVLIEQQIRELAKEPRT
ncbi:unnamed protein product [Diatraea saccharalis]|uniref:Uncharacterized protein n=1 Tax=Diatraea saccharalis TaxID=40085 RepID=A0A9N9QZM5_9NEOP|nr:unnamed protein product [Diatraea saccharalis]